MKTFSVLEILKIRLVDLVVMDQALEGVEKVREMVIEKVPLADLEREAEALEWAVEDLV